MIRTFGGALITLFAGATGGALLMALHIPLPWVLGSFFATAVYSQCGAKFSLPPFARSLAMMIVGTMLGSGFDSQSLTHIVKWLPSILMALALTAVFFTTAYAVLRRFSDMDRTTAFLAAVPGGLSVVSSIAEDMGGDMRRIGLSHTCRLIVLLLAAPILIGFISDYDLAAASTKAITEAPPFEPAGFVLLLGCALLGAALAKLLKFNSGMLMFPLILSAVVHVTGLSHSYMPPPLSIFAQLVIGCGIGMRFQGYKLRTIIRDGWLSCVIGLAFAVICLGAAWLMGQVTGLSAPALLLAFLPGGAPELGVVALTLGIEPALVATHSMIRVLSLIAAMASFRTNAR